MTSIFIIPLRATAILLRVAWFLIGIVLMVLLFMIKCTLLLALAPLMFGGGGGSSYGTYDRSSNVFKVGEGW